MSIIMITIVMVIMIIIISDISVHDVMRTTGVGALSAPGAAGPHGGARSGTVARVGLMVFCRPCGFFEALGLAHRAAMTRDGAKYEPPVNSLSMKTEPGGKPPTKKAGRPAMRGSTLWSS